MMESALCLYTFYLMDGYQIPSIYGLGLTLRCFFSQQQSSHTQLQASI